MTEHEISPVELPRETITVTPKPDGLELVYEEVDGHELFSVMVDDARVGHIKLMLTPSLAQHVAMTLWAMVKDLDTLPRDWNERGRTTMSDTDPAGQPDGHGARSREDSAEQPRLPKRRGELAKRKAGPPQHDPGKG